MWLIHFADDDSLNGELEKVAEALTGVFRVGIVEASAAKAAGIEIPSGDSTVWFYGDDKESPIAYTGGNNLREYVKFVLSNVKELVDARSKSAKQLKEQQEFMEREE